MEALAITSLSAADVAKQYEHISELGKGTYGKVDLVAHRTQGVLKNTVSIFYCDIFFPPDSLELKQKKSEFRVHHMPHS